MSWDDLKNPPLDIVEVLNAVRLGREPKPTKSGFYMRFRTKRDGKVCKICAPLDGKVWNLANFNEATIPWVGTHPNCLTPETEVFTIEGYKKIKDIKLGELVLTHKGRYRVVTKLHVNNYDGQIYNINNSGWLTGNHPVLTDIGWVDSEFINKSFEVISLKNNYFPSNTFKEIIFSCVGLNFLRRFMPVSSINFDSNLLFRDGEINIEFVNSVLWDSFDSESVKDYIESVFKVIHSTSLLNSYCSFHQILQTPFLSSNRIMGFNNLFFSNFFTHMFPFNCFGLTCIPISNICFYQNRINRASTNPEAFRDLIYRYILFPMHIYNFVLREIQPFTQNITPITNIDNKYFNGKVYNLSVSEDESYVIGENKLIVHNCRCELQYEEWKVVKVLDSPSTTVIQTK